MGVENILAEFRQRFAENGEFILRNGESINQVVRAKVPNDPHGVYVISIIERGGPEIVYMGKAGTLRQNGGIREQTIRRRLTMKQNGIYRREFFQLRMNELNLDSLHFEWFVTFGNGARTPPFLAEAQLLAAFFDEFNCLPSWNKGA